MKKGIVFLLLFFTSNIVEAQVGINTTLPNAQLDIRSSNQASPSNTDGILIPKVNVFPAINPTAAQQGMLVYLTTTSGTDSPGFYYWDNATIDWKPIIGTSVGTLDQSYDFGGAGNGKTIIADAGAVTIEGTDGFVATGTFGSGAIAPSGAGTRMVWNPRKGAFRAGNSVGNEWDDASIGNYSAAFGLNNTASATYSFASGIGNTASSYSSFATGFNTVASGDLSTTFGYETVASGEGAVAFGSGSDATGYFSTAFGSATLASGIYATTFGNSTTASGMDSASFGTQTTASAQSSVAFGNQTLANGPNSASFGQQSSASGNVSFSFGQNTGANAPYSAAFGYWSNSSGDSSFVAGRNSSAGGDASSCFGESNSALGNNSFAAGRQNTASGINSTIFGHNATAYSFGETVLGIGATTYAPSLNGNTQFRTANATDRLFVIGNAIDANNNDVVDAAERSDAIVVLKNGNTGFGTSSPQSKVHVVGNLRMVDGNQAAGRVLTSDGNGTATWQNASANAWGLVGNTGTNPTTNFIGTTDNVDLVFRRANVLSGRIGTSNTFFGRLSGSVSTATNNTYIGTEAGRDNVTGQQNVFIGRRAGTFGASGSDNILIGNGAGIFNEANQNCFIGSFSGNGTTTGANNSFYGDSSGLANGTGSQNAFFGASAGITNTIGIGNTLLGTSSNVSVNNLNNAAAIGFRSFVGANNSMVLGSINGVNGATSSVNVGIGTTTPLDRLHVVGNIRVVDGNQAAGRVLTSDANGTATWQNASANAWGLGGNAGTNAATNFIGTTDNIDLVFRRGTIISGRLGDSNTFFGRNSGVVNTGTSNTFIGERAGIANVSGSSNTFLGRLAGANGASGNDNTYLGYATGLNNTGNGNVILGAFSSQNTTGGFNVFMGYSAGSTNTTGSRNTTIGTQSDVGVANLTNATAIGNLAQVDASNSLVLGSINGVNGSLVSTNVGIGTTSPLTRLDIVDENTTTSNLVYGNLHVRSNNAQNIDIGGAVTLGGYNDDTMVQPRVFGSVEGRKSNATTNSSSGYLSFKTNNAGTLAERMRITNAGSVGIGTPTPGGLLELSLDQGRKPGTNTWTIVSDQRLKTINGKYTKGLNEILQLNPIRFNYKNSGQRTFEEKVLDTEFPGFIAQEVQPLFPDAIGTDADGFLNFNIHPILIASVNAIKELNAKNTQLQSENQSLKAELDQQKVVFYSD
jgi:trimeric autotransporter adhesin